MCVCVCACLCVCVCVCDSAVNPCSGTYHACFCVEKQPSTVNPKEIYNKIHEDINADVF